MSYNNRYIPSILDWSREEDAILRDSYSATASVTAATSEIYVRGYRRSMYAVMRRLTELGLLDRRQQKDIVAAKLKDDGVAPDRTTAYEDAWKRIEDIRREYTPQDFEHCGTGTVLAGPANKKILCLSDMHIPFQRDDLIRDAINTHANADILVVNGDLLDAHGVSTWPKERNVILRKEYEIAMEYLKLFADRFPRVIITKGNHEDRLNKYFHSNLIPAVSFLVDKDIINRLANGEIYDEYGTIIHRHKFDNVHYKGGLESWYVKIGKTVFAHPSRFSSIEGRTVINAEKYFVERTDVQAIVMAHTHQQAWIPSRNKLCIEQGCLCCPLDYEKSGRMAYKAMGLGYCVIYMDTDGNVDFNKSRLEYYGTQYPTEQTFTELLS